MASTVSFDVFDTLLTRATGDPEAIFVFMGKELYEQNIVRVMPEIFARARAAAGHRAYSNYGACARLEHIYRELKGALCFNDRQIIDIMDCEYKTERRFMREVPGAAARVQQMRNAGKKICFISDMYLPSDFIKEQLIRFAIGKEEDRYYVSCEHGLTKSQGLFATMIEAEKIEARSAEHYGNDKLRDWLPARKEGIRAILLQQNNLNRYERILESHAYHTNGTTSLLAGAARLARLSMSAENESEFNIRSVSTGVVAPALVSFVLWVLKEAHQGDIKKLYFISRDGQLLMRIAKKLTGMLGLNIELRYLYGSRQAWHLPGMTEISERELTWILCKPDLLTLRIILKRLHMSLTETDSLPVGSMLRSMDPDKILSASEVANFKNNVLLTPSFKKALLEKAKLERETLMMYFKQEGLFDPALFGIVDLGWFGSSGKSLALFMGKTFEEYYFGLRHSSFSDYPTGRVKKGFVFNEQIREGFAFDNVIFYVIFLEIACSADHGLVEKYKNNGGRIEPELGDTAAKNVSPGDEHRMIRESVMRFLDYFTIDRSIFDSYVDCRPAIVSLMNELRMKPTYGEAKAWGAIPHEPYQDGMYARPWAQKYGWSDILRMRDVKKIGHYAYEWRAAALRLSPYSIRLAVRVRNILRRPIAMNDPVHKILAIVKRMIRE